ncbi:helix-turn-helix transcriptional regulator [Streptomyces sp. NPDC014748]|uniref:helix-turn-helix transcriptional regulator n=1 Tax=Streptomyces sp. NPDC014748 TaxID=3364905 RepID=UPI0036F9E34A
MVEPRPEGETLREIAARHNRSYDTLSNQWSQHPSWPDPIGKRGRAYVYDSTAVDAVIAEHFDRPAAPLEPRRLYTAKEIEALTGITAATIRADRSKGRWPAPDDDSGRAYRWYGATVSKAVKGRRGYHRQHAEASGSARLPTPAHRDPE